MPLCGHLRSPMGRTRVRAPTGGVLAMSDYLMRRILPEALAVPGAVVATCVTADRSTRDRLGAGRTR